MVCISPKSQGLSRICQYRHFEAQNRGISAIGDISPAQIFHRQREAQNRGFGDISPEMATLPEPVARTILKFQVLKKTKFFIKMNCVETLNGSHHL